MNPNRRPIGNLRRTVLCAAVLAWFCVGLRLAKDKNFSLRLDLAQILDEGGTRERNHWRFVVGSVRAY